LICPQKSKTSAFLSLLGSILQGCVHLAFTRQGWFQGISIGMLISSMEYERLLQNTPINSSLLKVGLWEATIEEMTSRFQGAII
jgi:hypothetical protein